MRFLVIYFQINEQHIGRAGLPLTALINYERNFLKLVLITLPLTLLASFAVSRYLVHLAMKPIGDVFTFQENFSSNVTHELRSPLASLKGNLEVALRKQRTPEEYRAALDLGLHEVDRITNLLNNLHLLASSKFKPLDLLRERTNMRAIFEELIKQFEPVFNAKGITVDAAGLHDLSCSCDSVLMRRAIENLFDNAIKYTPEGGSIRVSIVESERQLLLRIENSCALQVKEEVNNYFQPFFRGDQGRAVNTGGKGLGLYIARYVLRSHGGDIAMRVTESGTCLVEIAVPRA
jgi:signal transduction histidine kinase